MTEELKASVDRLLLRRTQGGSRAPSQRDAERAADQVTWACTSARVNFNRYKPPTPAEASEAATRLRIAAQLLPSGKTYLSELHEGRVLDRLNQAMNQGGKE